MADTKISNLTALAAAPDSGDFLAVVDTSASETKKLDAKYLVRDSGGSGAIVTGAYTLTLPATGTASVLGTAQTYSALKTFSAGLTFGGATLSTYTTGTWTPTYSLSSTDFDSITHGIRSGYYTIIGRLCYVAGIISTDAFTVGSGTGNLRISLPFTINASLGYAGFSVAYSYLWDAAFPTGSKSLVGFTNTAYVQIAIHAWSDTGTTYATSANMRTGSSNRNQLAFSGVYHI